MSNQETAARQLAREIQERCDYWAGRVAAAPDAVRGELAEAVSREGYADDFAFLSALATAVLVGDQPFGFSHEDVNILRYAAATFAQESWHDDAARINELAGRLAALLPPDHA